MHYVPEVEGVEQVRLAGRKAEPAAGAATRETGRAPSHRQWHTDISTLLGLQCFLVSIVVLTLLCPCCFPLTIPPVVPFPGYPGSKVSDELEELNMDAFTEMEKRIKAQEDKERTEAAKDSGISDKS